MPLIAAISSLLGNEMKNFTILEKPAMMVMGIECRTSNDPSAGPQDIPKHWGKFFSENIPAQIPNKASDEIIALYCDYEGDCTKPYSLVIGYRVTSSEQIPEGMVVKTLPATSYALFRAVGEHPKSLIDTWGQVWTTNLKRTYSGDFESYGDKFQADPKEVDVLIAIE
jgi:predicted transcriptional regulator YdeE